MNFIIGIDEAGRGAWAGPVVAGAFCARLDFDFSLFPGLTDSKKLTPRERERLFSLVEKVSECGGCFFASGSIDAQGIDTYGIREANRLAMQSVLSQVTEQVALSEISEIRVDGRDNYSFDHIDRQRVRYIVGGDLLDQYISAASIVAKVLRDRKMCDFSVEYGAYGYDRHKGYGTKKHQEALLHYGISLIHRKSYAPVKRLISEHS